MVWFIACSWGTEMYFKNDDEWSEKIQDNYTSRIEPETLGVSPKLPSTYLLGYLSDSGTWPPGIMTLLSIPWMQPCSMAYSWIFGKIICLTFEPHVNDTLFIHSTCVYIANLVSAQVLWPFKTYHSLLSLESSCNRGSRPLQDGISWGLVHEWSSKMLDKRVFHFLSLGSHWSWLILPYGKLSP